MKALLSKTGLGLLAALLLVLLFYARMLGEAQDTLDKARRVAATKKADEQAAKTTEAQRHRELVSALRDSRNSAAPGASAPAGTTLPATDSVKAQQTRLGLTPDGIRGPRTEAAVRAAQRPRTAVADSTARPQTRPVGTSPGGQPWGLAVLLLGLGAALYVGYQGWCESQATLVDTDPNDRDTSLLEALMGAFAGAIGRAMPIPRQVKRFASKARLQHNLLRQLADETRHKSAFPFAASQQVLAFLLLLLLEGRDTTPSDPRATPLRELGETAFVEALRERFRAWHRAALDKPTYHSFRQQAAQLGAPTYADLLAELDSAAADRLLIQLHRLNAGLLV